MPIPHYDSNDTGIQLASQSGSCPHPLCVPALGVQRGAPALERMARAFGPCALAVAAALQCQAAKPVLRPVGALVRAARPEQAWRLSSVRSAQFVARIHLRLGSGSSGVLAQGPRLLVKVCRPASLRILHVTTPADMVPGKPTVMLPFNEFASDGHWQIELAPGPKGLTTYYRGPAASQLDKLRGKTELLDLVSPDILFAPDPLKEFKRAGETQVGSVDVARYECTLPFEGRQLRYELLVSKATGLPLRMSLYAQDAKGSFYEEQRTDYSDWKLDPDFPPSTFDPTPPADAKPEDPEPPLYDPALKLGMEPHPLDTPTISGRHVSLAAYEGRVVLLDYWATWCGPCLAELPNVRAAYDIFHRQGLDVISISLDDQSTRARLPAFAKKHGMTWPQVCDGKGFDSPLAKAYRVSAIPFSLLIGRDGKIAAVNPRGPELDKAIRAALARK